MYNHQLDTFIKVAELGSFSKAAKELYITPTAIIKQMNLLEGTVGVTLFNRSNRGLTLTAAGESLLADAHAITTLAREAVERAREAGGSAFETIRVGSSPMTPTSFLTKLLPRVRTACPDTSFQIVTYENTPQNSRRILANMEEEIDIVGGIFDERFLYERGCAGLPLCSMDVKCAMSAEHPLAAKDMLTLDDLAGCTILLVHRGWNTQIDALYELIERTAPDVAIEEFPSLNVEVFNRCEADGCLLMTLDLWDDVHPLLVSRPVDWDCAVTFGILHRPHPSDRVQRFLDALA